MNNLTLIALMATATSGVMAGELLNKRDNRLAQSESLMVATGDTSGAADTLQHDLTNIWRFLGGDDATSWMNAGADATNVYAGSIDLLEKATSNEIKVDTV